MQSGLAFLVFQQTVLFLFVPGELLRESLFFSYRFSVQATGWVRGTGSGTDTWRAVYSIHRKDNLFPLRNWSLIKSLIKNHA